MPKHPKHSSSEKYEKSSRISLKAFYGRIIKAASWHHSRSPHMNVEMFTRRGDVKRVIIVYHKYKNTRRNHAGRNMIGDFCCSTRKGSKRYDKDFLKDASWRRKSRAMNSEFMSMEIFLCVRIIHPFSLRRMTKLRVSILVPCQINIIRCICRASRLSWRKMKKKAIVISRTKPFPEIWCEGKSREICHRF